jgi:hypothetical protein
LSFVFFLLSFFLFLLPPPGEAPLRQLQAGFRRADIGATVGD